MDLIQDLNWRYATKAYNDVEVSEDKIDFILEAINLSASSCGLQPYRLISVKDQALKEKLGANSFNKQIAQSSHLLVFAAFNKVTTQDLRDLVDRMAATQGVSVEALDGFFNAMNGFFETRTDEENKLWAQRQAYTALGTALIAAANARVDATPMEGFDAALFDELLGLPEKGLHSTVILSLGYRDEENDYLAKSPKVRLPLDEMVTKFN